MILKHHLFCSLAIANHGRLIQTLKIKIAQKNVISIKPPQGTFCAVRGLVMVNKQADISATSLFKTAWPTCNQIVNDSLKAFYPPLDYIGENICLVLIGCSFTYRAAAHIYMLVQVRVCEHAFSFFGDIKNHLP